MNIGPVIILVDGTEILLAPGEIFQGTDEDDDDEDDDDKERIFSVAAKSKFRSLRPSQYWSTEWCALSMSYLSFFL